MEKEAHLEFWKPQPRPPWQDWRTYSLLIPCLASALGAFVFMALSFSFTELDTLSQAFRTNVVILGAFAVAFGSTFGSVFSGLEIYRKVFADAVIVWDWVSLVLSVLTTVAGFAMGFAALLGATANWSAVAQIWGPLALGLLVALDSVGDIIEFGGLFGSYEVRMEQWLTERQGWMMDKEGPSFAVGEDLAAKVDVLARDVEHLAARWAWPIATQDDFATILAGMNGDWTSLGRGELIVALADQELAPPSERTISRWLKMVREANSE